MRTHVRPACVKPLGGSDTDTAGVGETAATRTSLASPVGAARGFERGGGGSTASTTAVATVAAGRVAGKRRDDPGKRGRVPAEVVVSAEEAGGDTVDGSRPLVPSFCPSDPFERYAALHRDIMEGSLEPR